MCTVVSQVSTRVPFLAVCVISAHSRVSAHLTFGCANGKRLDKFSKILRDLDDRNDVVDDSELDGNICDLDPFIKKYSSTS